MTQGIQTGALDGLKGGMAREIGGRFRREGMYIYLWLIHVEV